ncbi:MAG: hypothetical protein L0Y74_09600 [candidate division Zixibacteria bacterium]|nr:hypothetical protein [candidate division Zixibacteria bacterium]
MQREILQKNPSSDLQVYAIWIPMLVSDQVSRGGSKKLNDPRVTHFWDGEKIAGKYFAEQMGHPGQVAWDVYFLYGISADWDNLGNPVSVGAPVVEHQEELLDGVSKLPRSE